MAVPAKAVALILPITKLEHKVLKALAAGAAIKIGRLHRMMVNHCLMEMKTGGAFRAEYEMKQNETIGKRQELTDIVRANRKRRRNPQLAPDPIQNRKPDLDDEPEPQGQGVPRPRMVIHQGGQTNAFDNTQREGGLPEPDEGEGDNLVSSADTGSFND